MIRYALATPDDDAHLLALLREPMEGWARMAMTREPSFFAARRCGAAWGEEWAVLAREEETPVGMYVGARHAVHLNGMASTLGYLGGLRVTPTHRHRWRLVRDGYASIRALCPMPPPLWYSVIGAENRDARRLLEANLPGMPRYQFCNEFVTLAISTARARRRALWREADTPSQRAAICDFYNHHARSCQFSPVLTPDAMRHIGARFFVAAENGEIKAAMALWRQQAAKQIRAASYRPPLDRLRWLYNIWARLAGRVRLPVPNEPLEQSFLAFFAAADSDWWIPLIEDALALCPTPVLAFGLHAKHQELAPLCRAFAPAQYRGRVHAVCFDAPPELDGRPAQPDAALL
jgi:hypothetical protein